MPPPVGRTTTSGLVPFFDLLDRRSLLWAAECSPRSHQPLQALLQRVEQAGAVGSVYTTPFCRRSVAVQGLRCRHSAPPRPIEPPEAVSALRDHLEGGQAPGAQAAQHGRVDGVDVVCSVRQVPGGEVVELVCRRGPFRSSLGVLRTCSRLIVLAMCR